MPVRILAISTPLREEQRPVRRHCHSERPGSTMLPREEQRTRPADADADADDDEGGAWRFSGRRSGRRAAVLGRRCSGDGGGSCLRTGVEEEEEDRTFIGQGPLVPGLATSWD
jgi:hypothetical protein